MAVHDLKIAKGWFDAIISGRKTFEIREEIDRKFQENDVVVLREWISDIGGKTGQYTGRELIRRIGFLWRGDLDPVVVFALLPANDYEK